FFYFYFFFTDLSPSLIYTLSLHDALPICALLRLTRCRRDCDGCAYRKRNHRCDCAASYCRCKAGAGRPPGKFIPRAGSDRSESRSEEHTSELQSRFDLVCRLLLEKKKTIQ